MQNQHRLVRSKDAGAAAEEVEEAVRDLYKFYNDGAESREKQTGCKKREPVADEALRRGVSAEQLQKARAFARAYSRHDLHRLCELARKHQFPVGESLVVRLLSVREKREREALHLEANKGGWSKLKLDAEIWKRFPRRELRGGRRHGCRMTRKTRGTG